MKYILNLKTKFKKSNVLLLFILGGIMNIKRAVGQLFTVGFEGKKMNQKLIKMIHDYYIGGIVLFRENIGTPKELIQLIQDIQNEAKSAGYKKPLFISIDEENGTVKRLGSKYEGYPGAMSISASGNSQYAFDIGKALGKDLKRLGINWNFSPVLDINNNPNNPVISVRSFGETPDQVSKYGIKLMKGLQESGVVATAKHFPGHGDTDVDSHMALPKIAHDLEKLEKVELKPFKKAINEGVDCIMTAHILFPALESEKNRPATLSKNVITGLLRNKLGFNGIVVTDALEMKAISEGIGISNAAVEAIKAGVDNLLIGHLENEQIKAMSTVIKSVKDGDISQNRIEESLNRINTIKDKYLNWPDLDKDIPSKSEKFYSIENNELINNIYEESVTIVKKGNKIDRDSSVLVLQPKDNLRTIAEDTRNDDYIFTNIVKKYIKNVDIKYIDNNLTEEEKLNIMKKLKNINHIILGTISIEEEDNILDFINQISEERSLNIISMKNPYVGKYFDHVNYWINTYEMNKVPIEIAIQTLLSEKWPTGKSPINLDFKRR